MNGYKTLREVCKSLNLSRRAIQGYENIGLIKPTAKNKYGYLLYDEATISKIAGIQYCQKLGLELKDIFMMTNYNSNEICDKLRDQLIVLNNKRNEFDYLIKKTDEIIIAVQNSNDKFLDIIYETIKEE